MGRYFQISGSHEAESRQAPYGYEEKAQRANREALGQAHGQIRPLQTAQLGPSPPERAAEHRPTEETPVKLVGSLDDPLCPPGLPESAEGGELDEEERVEGELRQGEGASAGKEGGGR